MAYVLILGAGSDVAVACAREFAKNSFDLYLAGRNRSVLEAHANDFQIRHSIKAKAVDFDASKFETHAEFFESLDPKPEITICVFGYLGDQAIAAAEWEESKKIIDANYTGAISILNRAAAYYGSKHKGVIAGISSVAGERGRQSNYIYGSAKAGFTAYLSGLRNSMTHQGVHVVTVKPGFINTKMTEGLNLPKPLTAQPTQVGEAVYKAIVNRKNVIYVLPVWRIIMLVIRNIPEFIFKKLKM